MYVLQGPGERYAVSTDNKMFSVDGVQ